MALIESVAQMIWKLLKTKKQKRVLMLAGQQPGNQSACWDGREEGQAFDLCECVRVCAVARTCK